MFYFRLPFLGVSPSCPTTGSQLITCLWLLGMTQAINLIDGLDGLAAGIVAIGAFAFFLYSQRLSELDLRCCRGSRRRRRWRRCRRPAVEAVDRLIAWVLPHNFNTVISGISRRTDEHAGNG